MYCKTKKTKAEMWSQNCIPVTSRTATNVASGAFSISRHNRLHSFEIAISPRKHSQPEHNKREDPQNEIYNNKHTKLHVMLSKNNWSRAVIAEQHTSSWKLETNPVKLGIEVTAFSRKHWGCSLWINAPIHTNMGTISIKKCEWWRIIDDICWLENTEVWEIPVSVRTSFGWIMCMHACPYFMCTSLASSIHTYAIDIDIPILNLCTKKYYWK